MTRYFFEWMRSEHVNLPPTQRISEVTFKHTWICDCKFSKHDNVELAQCSLQGYGRVVRREQSNSIAIEQKKKKKTKKKSSSIAIELK